MVGAQNQSSNNTNVTVPQKMGVKIISPSKNTTVPTDELSMESEREKLTAEQEKTLTHAQNYISQISHGSKLDRYLKG